MPEISRRSFTKKTVFAAAVMAVNPLAIGGQIQDSGSMIPLGGPLFGRFDNPEEWIKLIRATGYKAVYCPLTPGASPDEIKNYKKAASEAGITIAEVGAWSNPISPDTNERKAAILKCIDNLLLADEIEASCCVNISGSRNSEYCLKIPK